MAAVLFAAVIFVFNVPHVLAQEGVTEDSFVLGEETPIADSGAGPASGWVIFRMILVLALAALAIYGVVFFIKRAARPRSERNPHLKILASVPLGPGAFSAVISVGSKAYLVGGGDGGVSLIAEIDEQEALETMLIDYARQEAEERGPALLDFSSLLRKFGSRKGMESRLSSHAESLRKQRDRLKGL
ncbi:MAG: flagellar biosynthetic protein FliO [Treponema sp.]|nr:flagellar biosynthetic protein FliO [Treponema sp.]